VDILDIIMNTDIKEAMFEAGLTQEDYAEALEFLGYVEESVD